MEGQGQNAKAIKRSPPTASIQQDFLFVDASDAKASRQGRRNARSFVMQRARRERPWSTSKQAAKQRSQESASPRSAGTLTSISTPNTTSSSPNIENSKHGYFPLVEQRTVVERGICSNCRIFVVRHGQSLCPKCLLLKAPGSVNEPGNGALDPFGASCIKIDRETSELLNHFTHEMAPGIIGVDIRRRSTLMKSDWFDTALSNKGFMHSLLSTAALHMFVFGKGTVQTILHHRAKAIVSVNKALSSQGCNVRFSDANLGAVFNLLTVEEGLMMPHFRDEIPYDKQPNAMMMHLNGLKEMLHLRGGLKAVGTNRILQAFILWHTTAHAIAAFAAPNPTTIAYIRTASFPHHPRGYTSKYSRHLVDLCRHAGFTESLTELLESVLIFAADLNAWYDDPESLLDALDIQNFSCALECLLLAWLTEREPLVTPLEGALCVSLIIFTVRTTEALKRPSDIHLLHFVASKRLESALNCTTRAEWQPCPDLLLWILTIGAISAEGSAESAWFVHQSSLACAEFNIDSAEALLGRLGLCGWVDYKLDDSVHHLWNKIVHFRLEPYLNVPSPNLENADSPPGPLQNNFKEPELTDWRTIDWAAVIAATPVQEANTSNEGVSWTTAVATGFDDSFDDALNDIGRDFGGYGLLWR